jgi:hypothetical protein
VVRGRILPRTSEAERLDQGDHTSGCSCPGEVPARHRSRAICAAAANPVPEALRPSDDRRASALPQGWYGERPWATLRTWSPLIRLIRNKA